MGIQRISVLALAAAALALAAGCSDEATGPGNRAPGTGLEADPGTVDPSGTSSITSTATDPDGDALSYAWNADAGTISGTGATITWTAPLAAGSYEVSVTVDDGQGHATSDTVGVEVRSATLLMKSRDGVVAVGMDASSFILYSSFVEVEVLGTRIFVGPANVRELDHSGNVIGGPGTPPEVTRVTSFTILPDGGIAFTENWTDSVFFVGPDGTFLDAVQLNDMSGTNQGVKGLVVANDLIISETGNRELARIDLTTREVSVLKDLSHLTTWLGDIEYLGGMYYLTQWESLYEFTETGKPAEIAHIDDGSILGVAVVGTSAFITSRHQGKIYRVDIPTRSMEMFAEGFNEPYEIEYLPAGLVTP
jgi:hypothetical protein